MPRSWANYILKFNRSQLPKRKIRKLKDMLQNDFQKKGVSFKEVSQEELQLIKNEIRAKAKKESKKTFLLYALSIGISVLLIRFIYAIVV